MHRRQYLTFSGAMLSGSLGLTDATASDPAGTIATTATVGGDPAPGIYRIEAVHSGKVLDVAGQSPNDGATVHQWAWHGGANQRWTVTPLDDGTVRITSVHSGLALDVAGDATDNGDDVIQSEWTGAASQRWRLEQQDDGTYRISNEHSGRVLDIAEGSTENGANVNQWEWHGGDNQRLRLEQLDDRSFVAEPSRSETVVEAPVSVRVRDTSGVPNWSIVDAPSGSDATVRDHRQRTTSVQPDVAGEYTLAAEIGDVRETLSFTATERSDVIEQFAPRLHFSNDGQYRPTRIEALVENATLLDDGDVVTDDPTLFDLAGRDASHYLELDGDESAYPGYQHAYDPTIYANVVPETEFRGERFTAISYWFVYVYDPKHGFASFGSHQADVESTVVLLDENHEPAYLVPFSHGATSIVPFEQAPRDGTHPHLYPEHRSHATFLKNTAAYDGDGIQPQSFWSDANADCFAIDTFEAVFHSERTGDDERWSHDGTVGTAYDLIELTGTEIWADYAGGLSNEPGSITPPHQRQHFHDPGTKIEGRGCPEHAQLDGWVRVDGIERDGDSVRIDVTVGNRSAKPHPFWISIVTSDGQHLGSEQLRVGTSNPSFFGGRNDRTRSGSVTVEAAAGVELRAELWLHPPAVRRDHDLVDSSESFHP